MFKISSDDNNNDNNKSHSVDVKQQMHGVSVDSSGTIGEDLGGISSTTIKSKKSAHSKAKGKGKGKVAEMLSNLGDLWGSEQYEEHYDMGAFLKSL